MIVSMSTTACIHLTSCCNFFEYGHVTSSLILIFFSNNFILLVHNNLNLFFEFEDLLLDLCLHQTLQTILVVTTLTLGSWPRQGLAKVRAKSEPGSHISCSQECKRMWRNEPHTPKWTPTLGVGGSMDFWIFRRQLQRQNSLDWEIPCIIRT